MAYFNNDTHKNQNVSHTLYFFNYRMLMHLGRRGLDQSKEQDF